MTLPAGSDGEEWPPSPCFGYCQLNAARQQCLGCRRTVGEITAWRALSPAEKLAIWAELPRRGGRGLPDRGMLPG